ncbi:MAG TPA: IPT/TIG domain-containing protein, partial [Oscillospiraceae bacterium]|nr:IPT/TIG domain-containing protein [Oscillospiraceae bacterium]
DYKDDENYERNFYLIETDDTEKVTLSDGKSSIYEIKLKDNGIVAVKDNDAQAMEVGNNFIKIGDKTLKFKTPFALDPDTGAITGHRAKVKNRNEIWVTIPGRSLPGFYDVMVKNPDTKSFTVAKGFEYLNPQSKPKISYISPSQGSVDGGYEVTIYGEGFENTTEIYVAGEKVLDRDTEVDKVNYKSVTITVPKYPGDVDTDFKTDKKFVPITVLNEDGGSANADNLFAYVVASSRPRIDKISPVKGTAAGGDVVEIWGYDFRYFEPYKGEEPKEGDTNFEDLDRDGKWTRYSGDRDVPEKFRKELDHKDLREYIDSPVLPTVYFGNQKAKIVEFAAGRIKVVSPGSTVLGNVDVYVLNNDAGTSNKVKFTYEGSNPNIRDIIPNVGRKQGGEKVDIEGSNFKVNNIDIINKDGKTSTYLVRFGEISNIQIPREAENSGLINQGVATVNLVGGLKVEHKTEDGSGKIIVSITESGTTYTQKYFYDFGIKYIDVQGLKDKEDNDNSYKGNELIKVEVDNGRLLVTRGYSPQVKERFAGHLEVVTPTYYSVGNVNVVVENPDGISNKVVYQYKNPDSNPKITNITRDGQQPQLADDGERKILTVNIKGGSEIVIEGSDFRDVQRIQIGNVLNIEPGDILVNEPNRLVFKMPAVGDGHATEFLHRVVVTNYDGGIASSNEAYLPIYIQFTKGESNPEIESITPPRGPDSGGNTVIIKGKDFRETMDSYTGEKLKVYFDGNQVPHSDVRVVDYRTISVVAPPGTAGPVEVKVENPDGEMSNTVEYTYASNPKITSVVDPLDTTEKAIISAISIEGGQEIKLKGTGFMEGAKVYFAPEVTPAAGTEQVTGRIIYIQGNPYILEEGTEGTDFEFIDDETVIIKTPKLKAESKGVIIVNPDEGASPIYTNLIYGLPEIAVPSWIAAELVYDRFIRVHWGAVSGATEYEIFVVADNKITELIGSTGFTSFVYNDLEPRTRYKFIVKAVGDFGSSKPSLESNTVRTGKVVGPPDEDGELAENTVMSKTGNTANVVIGTSDRGTAPVTIDLTGGILAGSTEAVISIPADVILKSGSRNIQVTGKDFSLNFRPSAFNVAVVRENRNRTDAGVRFIIAPDKGNTQVPSGNQLSTVYNLDATVYVGKSDTIIDYLAGPINLILDYDTQKADLRKLNYADLSYFSPEINSWQPVGFSTGAIANSVLGTVNRLGRYTVVGSRR